VHPLVGWSQGHFRERIDGQTGQPAVFTSAGKAVSGISTGASSVQQRQVLPGTGTARGVLVEDEPSASRPAMSVTAFKDEIRRTVAAPLPDAGVKP
jgi:hypothetical protein